MKNSKLSNTNIQQVAGDLTQNLYFDAQREAVTNKILADIFDEPSMNNKYQFNKITPYDFPIPIEKGSKRQKLVEELLRCIETRAWLHIRGNRWGGKTQLLLLVSEHFEHRLWCDFYNKDDSEKIKELIIMIDAINEEDNSFLCIDNLPDLSNFNQFAKLMFKLINLAEKKGLKVLTTGLHSLPFIMDNILNQEKYLHIDLPDLTENEVKEVFTNYEAPKDFLETKMDYFIYLSKKAPAVLSVITRYLVNNNWIITDLDFKKLLTLDFMELSDEIQKIVSQNIKDQDERELLYRVAFPGHALSFTMIKSISEIDPTVVNVYEKLTSLKSGWLDYSKDAYHVPNVLRNISDKNLSSELKEEISSRIADEIMSKQTLNEIDLTRVITHLINAKKFDDAGRIYIQGMYELIQSDSNNLSQLGMPTFWEGTKLPKEMSIEIRGLIRFSQMYYSVKHQPENVTLFEEEILQLCNLSRVNQKLLYTGSVLFMSYNFDIGLKLFKESRSMISNSDELNIMDETVIVSALFLWGYNVYNLSTFKEWYQTIISLSVEQLQSLKYSEEFQQLTNLITEKVRLSLDKNEEEEYFDLMIEIFHYSLKIEFWGMLVSCFQTIINISNQSQRNTDLIVKEYADLTKIENLPREYEVSINYRLGVYHYEKDRYSVAKDYFTVCCTDVSCLNTIEQISFYIAVSRILLQDNKKNESHSMLEKALHLSKINELGDNIRLKIYGEYFINCYLTGKFSDGLEQLYLIIVGLLESEIEQKELITLILNHNIFYISRDIFSSEPPKIINDEEDYSSPEPNMFWGNNNDDFFEKEYDLGKFTSLIVGSCRILSYYNKNEEVNHIMPQLLKLLREVEKDETFILYTQIDLFFSEYLIENGYSETALNFLFLKNIRAETDFKKDAFLDRNLIFLATIFFNLSIDGKGQAENLLKSINKFQTNESTGKEWCLYQKIINSAKVEGINSPNSIDFDNQEINKNMILKLVSSILVCHQLEPKEALRIQVMMIRYIEVSIKDDFFFLKNVLHKYFNNSWVKLINKHYDAFPSTKQNVLYCLRHYNEGKLTDIWELLHTIEQVCNIVLDSETDQFLSGQVMGKKTSTLKSEYHSQK